MACLASSDAMAQAVSEKGAVSDLMQHCGTGTIHDFTGVALPARAATGLTYCT
jgi:hypothetical protein